MTQVNLQEEYDEAFSKYEEDPFEDIKEAKKRGKEGISTDEYKVLKHPELEVGYKAKNGSEIDYLEKNGWEEMDLDELEDADIDLYESKGNGKEGMDISDKYTDFDEELGDHMDALENIKKFIDEYDEASESDGLGDLYDKNDSKSRKDDGNYFRNFDFSWEEKGNMDTNMDTNSTIAKEVGGSVLNAGPLDLVYGPFTREFCGEVYEGMTANPSYDSEIPEKYRVFEELWKSGYKDDAKELLDEKEEIAEEGKEKIKEDLEKLEGNL